MKWIMSIIFVILFASPAFSGFSVPSHTVDMGNYTLEVEDEEVFVVYEKTPSYTDSRADAYLSFKSLVKNGNIRTITVKLVVKIPGASKFTHVGEERYAQVQDYVVDCKNNTIYSENVSSLYNNDVINTKAKGSKKSTIVPNSFGSYLKGAICSM